MGRDLKRRATRLGLAGTLGMALLSSLSCETSAPTPGAPPATIVRAGSTFTAEPDPVLLDGDAKMGVTTLSWTAPVASVQVRVGTPGGPLFASEKGVGHATTGPWVKDGLVFYLQDGTAPDPTAPSATLATLAVPVKKR